jgi:hypothetical protein
MARQVRPDNSIQAEPASHVGLIQALVSLQMIHDLSIPFVEIRRVVDEPSWHGFIVVESKFLVVFHRVSDRYDLDGYCAFRREDI